MDTASLILLNLSDSDFSIFFILFSQISTFHLLHDRSRYLTIDEFGRMLFKLDGDAHGNFSMKILG